MTPFELLALRFLLASCACLVVGVIVWLVLLLGRRSPELNGHRSVWLLSQLTIAAAFLVIMVPHSERLRIAPVVELDRLVADSAAMAEPTVFKKKLSTVDAPEQSGATPRSALAVAGQLWLAVYLLGLGYAVCQLLKGWRGLHGLAALGNTMDLRRVLTPAQGAAFADRHARRLTVLEVDAAISPMLYGMVKPHLLVPRHLRRLSVLDQQLIIEHELTHLQRYDLLWMSVAIGLQVVFWFHPVMRLLSARLLWAQELGCDRTVLDGRPDDERRAYASALVAQLRYQRHASQTALAFGGVNGQTVAARIAYIRTPPHTLGSCRVRLAALTALASIVAASIAFQPALAWHDGAPAHGTARSALSCTIMADAATGELLLSEGACDERVTPASTFNIAVSLMGYDSGVLRDEHAPTLPFRAGYPDYIDAWRASTDPSSWIRHSVLWYAQQITERLGAQRFARYMGQFGYGNGDISGDPGKGNGLTMSWLSSSLEISPVEQVSFLRKLVNRDLPVSAKAYDMTTRILLADRTPEGWEIRGKTGTATPVLSNGDDDLERHYGWYVGWAQKGGRTIVFARLVLDQRVGTDFGGMRAKHDFLARFSQRMATQ